MRRIVPPVMLLVLATLTGRILAAEPVISLDELRAKTAISAEDRSVIKAWMAQKVAGLMTVSEADKKTMVSARESIVYEGRPQAGRSAEFIQAFGEEAIAALTDPATETRAVSPEARLNLVMAVAQLQRPEGVPFLCTALAKDPYPATRFWAARGLSLAADAVVEKNQVRTQSDMTDAAEKIFQGNVRAIEAKWLLDMLGKFDIDKAHDVLADAVVKFVQHSPANDPVTAETMDLVLKPDGPLAKAYSRESRPEAKSRILASYATVCVWLQPPTALANLMPDINASLEAITGEKIGFMISDTPQGQQLSLVEWAEKLVRDKKIAKRPALPKAVEDIVKEQKEEAIQPPPAPPAPIPAPSNAK
jgi:hypothetical protein